MKHEIGIVKPDYLVEDWAGKFEAFSWLEYAVSVPNPIFIVTTLKANGKSNANLQSWGLLLGGKDGFYSVLAMLKHQHTYSNILRNGEWCINYPSFKDYPKCFETIYCNSEESDEIALSSFTIEEPKVIKAPRIAESLINLECTLEWDRPLIEGSNWHLLCGKVVNVAVDDNSTSPDPIERMKNMQLMYNIRSTVNPLNGEFYGPNTLGLLSEVVKTFSNDGTTKLWEK